MEKDEGERDRKDDSEKSTVEHPFGTIKRAMNQGYLLLKGLKKVRGRIRFKCYSIQYEEGNKHQGCQITDSEPVK